MSKDKSFMRFIGEESETPVIEIYGTIGDYDWEEDKVVNTIKEISKELQRIKNLKSKKIEVRICSFGGYIDQALAIYDALKDHPAEITTVMNSFCASAATVIAMAGDVRKISKNSLFLIHHCISGTYGNDHDLEMLIEEQKLTNDRMFSIYKEHCTKSENDLKELFDYNNGKGKWIDADEVLEYGFATEIYNDDKATNAKVAAADLKIMDKLNLPDLPKGYEIEKPFSMKDFVSKHFDEIKEFFLPKNDKLNTNSKTNQMKKFSEQFALIAAIAIALSDKEYDPAKGVTFDDEQLKALEKQMKELSGYKEKFTKLEAEKKTADEQIATLTSEKETLKAERDDWKKKYGELPAHTDKVDGKDQTEDSFEAKLANDPYYQEIEKSLNII